MILIQATQEQGKQATTLLQQQIESLRADLQQARMEVDDYDRERSELSRLFQDQSAQFTNLQTLYDQAKVCN